jgi:hypothetical protein
MIPAPRTYGFDSLLNVLMVMPPAMLAALVVTMAYAVYVEKIEPLLKGIPPFRW